LVDEKISELAGKGINVDEIEKQTKSTDEKISALEEELEKLLS
jgi:predicted ATP-grasp superfamily ATP-dependent carboligase